MVSSVIFSEQLIDSRWYPQQIGAARPSSLLATAAVVVADVAGGPPGLRRAHRRFWRWRPSSSSPTSRAGRRAPARPSSLLAMAAVVMVRLPRL